MNYLHRAENGEVVAKFFSYAQARQYQKQKGLTNCTYLTRHGINLAAAAVYLFAFSVAMIVYNFIIGGK
jgi:hypothetical protein